MQISQTIHRKNIKRFLCRNCGANMFFNPQTGQLTCSYCQSVQAIEATGTIDEQDYQAFLRDENERLRPMAKDAMQVRCDGCGAIMNFTPPETTAECDFCTAKIIAQPKSADPLIAPEGVLPFSITDTQAIEAFKTWMSSLLFAPNKLKKFARTEKISSIYIPYWTYDTLASSLYDGKHGEYSYVTGKREIFWVDTGGVVKTGFDDICIPATKSLPKKYLDQLEPWDLQELKPFEPAFLTGHKAQTYQVSLEEGFNYFKERTKESIEKDILKDIGGDKQKIGKVETKYLMCNSFRKCSID